MNVIGFSVRAWLVVCFAAGCVVTESGNPPIVDTDQVLAFGAIGTVFILSGTNAVDPPGGDIFLANLTRGGLEISPVDREGSFTVQVTYEVGDGFRLQAIGADGQLSVPFDFRTTTGSDRLPLEGDLPCVSVELGEGGAMLTNACADARSLSLRTVRGRPVTPATLELAPRDSGTIAFDVAATPDILVLEDGSGFLSATTLP